MKNNNQVPFCDLEALRKMVRTYAYKPDEKKPLIGISANHAGVDQELRDNYIKAVIKSGGAPYIIPYSNDTQATVRAVERCHGIIITGGGDVHPLWFGEEPKRKIGSLDITKDKFDIAVTMAALQRGIPVLGICRGMQLLNIVLGGTLHQDINDNERENPILHDQTAHRSEPWHSIEIDPESRLSAILGGKSKTYVNSVHHQSVDKVPPCVKVVATASDGVIEAIDAYPEHNAIGVQWHPEALVSEGDSQEQVLVFDHIVREAALYAEAKAFHVKYLTLDSHCDTPMLMKEGEPYNMADLSDKALVDVPKMVAGHLDAAVMAAYIPQGEITEEGHEAAYKLVNIKLKQLKEAVKASHGQMRMVYTPNDVWRNKKSNTKSVFMAIENGYALGGDSNKVEEFAMQGVKYITLCHNGDNAICDSARNSEQRHGGLSIYGREVIRKMNYWGVMIDVSHAATSTLADVLEQSQAPIIASHSGAKAVCDHPRNLTDEEIKAIAKVDGVVQVCMYKGFVHEPEEEASLLHVIDHIEHIRNLVGIDYVGIGSDFDGDGEVIGCRDASAVKRLTMEMLRRGFSYEDLRKVWGLNFLRVMKQVYKIGIKARNERDLLMR